MSDKQTTRQTILAVSFVTSLIAPANALEIDSIIITNDEGHDVMVTIQDDCENEAPLWGKAYIPANGGITLGNSTNSSPITGRTSILKFRCLKIRSQQVK